MSKVEPARWQGLLAAPSMDPRVSAASTARAVEPAPERTEVFGMRIDALTFERAIEAVRAVLAAPAGARRAPVLLSTVNTYHAVLRRRVPQLRAALAASDLVVADGAPVVWASRLSERRLSARITGADLIGPICAEAVRRGAGIFVLGTTLEVLSIACRRLVAQHPGLRITGVYAPSFGFGPDHPECREVLAMLDLCRPEVLFIALGAPKQEVFAHVHRQRLRARLVIGVGAGFDYIAGRPARAPLLFRRIGLEWFWRLLRSPRRLGKRYATVLGLLPLLVAGQLRHQRRVIKAGRAP